MQGPSVQQGKGKLVVAGEGRGWRPQGGLGD